MLAVGFGFYGDLHCRGPLQIMPLLIDTVTIWPATIFNVCHREQLPEDRY
jgi:hypothetical protein